MHLSRARRFAAPTSRQAFVLLLAGGIFAGLACKTDSRPPEADRGAVESPAPAPEEEDAAAIEAAPSADVAPTFAHATGSPDAPAPAVAADPEPDEPPPVDAASPEPQKVLILGDSLAATGFGAMLEKRLDAHPQVVCYRKGKSASGLARPDFFDWIAEGKRQVELRQPDLVVVILGGNDGQDLTPRKRSGDKRVAWQHDDWAASYRARIDEFLGVIAAPGRRILWLGLPTMGLRSLEQKLELIRSIQAEAVAAVGDDAVYLDTTPFVTDENGQMLREARVGERGKLQQIRAEDRIHFTMPGSEYLADRVYPEVLAVLGLPDAPAE